MAATATAAANAAVREIEREGARQAIAAKGAAGAKGAAAAKGAAGAKTVAAGQAGGAKGAVAGKAVLTGKATGTAKSCALFGIKGASLGAWGPIALGIIGAAIVYKMIKSGGSEDNQSETDLEIKEALG